MGLKEELLAERRASYARLSGGFPIPLAGAVYWGALGYAGSFLPLKSWIVVAFWGSGAIFPLALLFAAIFRNGFMKDRTAVDTLLAPAFIGMLLFWPMAAAALQVAPELTPLILAIGMSMHWPAIGWMYGRPQLYSAHSIVRAALATAIWFVYPEERLTWLPYSVAAVYLVTVIAIVIDSAGVRARLAKAAA